MLNQNLQFRNLTDMAPVPRTHVATEVTAVADLLTAAHLLVESHHVYSSLLEGARMGMLRTPSGVVSMLILID